MPEPAAHGLTKSQIEKAGRQARKFHRGEITADEFEPWRQKIIVYRKCFETPLVSVNNSLRYYLDKGNFRGTVTQRLKRLTTILKKLTDHESQMNLSRMRDIGGCRIVTISRDDVYNIAGYLKAKMPVTDERDYIKTPRESGYRALHLIIERNGMPIEVQIRSEPMHEWAQNVEHFSGLLGSNFKRDGGDTPLNHLMRYQSDLQAKLEVGLALTDEERAQEAELTETFISWYIDNWF